MRKRPHSFAEELANSVSHGLGLLAALGAAPFLVLAAIHAGGAADIVGATVFSVTMVLLYTASTLYHAARPGRLKRLFRSLDQGAIFLFIAGTYTPFTLGPLHGLFGWILLGVVWTLAVVGIALLPLGALRRPMVSTSLYLMMGWLVVFAVRPMWLTIPPLGLALLLGGGLAYTIGVAFLVAKRLRYHHFMWHLWVLAGTTCHFFAVLWFAV